MADELFVRINLDVREYRRLREIEEKYLALNHKKPEQTSKDSGDNAPECNITQFGSGSLEVMQKMIENAVDKAFANRTQQNKEVIEIAPALPPESSTVTETTLSEAVVEPPPKVSQGRKLRSIKPQKWYYLGSAEDICSTFTG